MLMEFETLLGFTAHLIFFFPSVHRFFPKNSKSIRGGKGSMVHVC